MGEGARVSDFFFIKNANLKYFLGGRAGGGRGTGGRVKVSKFFVQRIQI